MKKIIIFIICLFYLTGCQSSKQTTIQEEYYITYNSIDIKLNTFFNNLLVTIGDFNDYRTEDSTYNEGTSNIYEYDYFEIETYFDDNIEKISSITITNEEQLTNEGIKIGDTLDEMLDVYGSDYTNPSEDIYIYQYKETNISFYINNGIIELITYYLS